MANHWPCGAAALKTQTDSYTTYVNQSQCKYMFSLMSCLTRGALQLCCITLVREASLELDGPRVGGVKWTWLLPRSAHSESFRAQMRCRSFDNCRRKNDWRHKIGRNYNSVWGTAAKWCPFISWLAAQPLVMICIYNIYVHTCIYICVSIYKITDKLGRIRALQSKM